MGLGYVLISQDNLPSWFAEYRAWEAAFRACGLYVEEAQVRRRRENLEGLATITEPLPPQAW